VCLKGLLMNHLWWTNQKFHFILLKVPLHIVARLSGGLPRFPTYLLLDPSSTGIAASASQSFSCSSAQKHLTATLAAGLNCVKVAVFVW